MATPGFGFSIGDFIAGIEVAIKIYQAFKETGGAASESNVVLTELRAYISLLQRLQDSYQYKTPEVNDLLSTCQVPIQEFCTKIERKWVRPAGPVSSTSTIHFEKFLRSMEAVPRKMKWALFDSKAVEKLRMRIAPPLFAIGLILDVESRYLNMTIFVNS